MQERQERKPKQQMPVSQLAASKRFGQYKKEEKKNIKQAEVKEDRGLGKIKEAWKEFMELRILYENIEVYECADSDFYLWLGCAVVYGIRPTERNIQKFGLSSPIKEYGDVFDCSSALGEFVSSLIEVKGMVRARINLRHMDEEIDSLGLGNSKLLEISGNAVDNLGEYNRGIIMLDGNAGRVGFDMQRGALVIKGDVTIDAGPYMQSGIIMVFGSVKDAGHGMNGGGIIVTGNAQNSGSSMSRGVIIVKGSVGIAGSEMNNGHIEIFGNVMEAGSGMKNGYIGIQGNAGVVGTNMEGGEIDVEGEIGSIGNVIHGVVLQKGKTIMQK